ncbi:MULTISPECIES: hypothetical protein [unclassified Streptomyces]|uniref:hypothetical protein n=1 Tax=unclassified Streptomyces TaxID=2593676 RepID=UPI00089A8CB1|nr:MULTISPECIES: hypothetical protein [unclassified Streptomyces]PKW07651.1 hypothetical protein BX260_2823 [Streptomyces sp. 5112.2]SEC83345.1 hypothetical protein SAMN05428944_5274 [Streptomyces sp. 1222.5]SEC95531.1 hypothetical protein SAMN05216532_2919 [Streptomyces sp. 2231.1]
MSGLLYETHVTVRCDDAAEAERLRGWADASGLKLTHIVLARGRMRHQPMLTLAGSSSYAEESARAAGTVAALRSAGFAPVRVKTESVPWAPEVPAGPCGGGQYFEHHAKLLLDAGTDLGALAARVVPHGAHLSWNARRARGGGRHERFVTQRCRGVSDAEAERALRRLLAELEGLDVLGVEREFVLYDSDESVDDGWIEEREVSV